MNFDFSLFKLREHGLQSVAKSRRASSKPICHSHVSRFESVRIVDCAAVVTIVFYGVISALILLCIELILNKLRFLKKNSYSAGILSRKI